MPTIKTPELAAIDVLERWRDRILLGVDDIIAWRNADPDTLLRRNDDPRTAWPVVDDLYNDAASVCSFIRQFDPLADVGSINRLFGIVNTWLLTKAADDLPTDEAIEVATDAAMLLVRGTFDRLLGEVGQTRTVPTWDTNGRVLAFRGKAYRPARNAAENVVTILQSFETANWPEHVASPFKTEWSQELSQILRPLNDALKRTGVPLRFHANGQRIRWSIAD